MQCRSEHGGHFYHTGLCQGFVNKLVGIGNRCDSMHKLVDKFMDRLPHYRWLQTNAKELELLVQHTMLAAIKTQPGARVLVNVLYGAAGIWKSVGVMTVGQLDKQLFKALARMAQQHLYEFNARDLANTAWALTDSAACTLGSW